LKQVGWDVKLPSLLCTWWWSIYNLSHKIWYWASGILHWAMELLQVVGVFFPCANAAKPECVPSGCFFFLHKCSKSWMSTFGFCCSMYAFVLQQAHRMNCVEVSFELVLYMLVCVYVCLSLSLSLSFLSGSSSCDCKCGRF
jgi:hypothetical protein